MIIGIRLISQYQRNLGSDRPTDELKAFIKPIGGFLAKQLDPLIIKKNSAEQAEKVARTLEEKRKAASAPKLKSYKITKLATIAEEEEVDETEEIIENPSQAEEEEVYTKTQFY